MPKKPGEIDERSEFLAVTCPHCGFEIRSARFKSEKAADYEQSLLTANLHLEEPLLLRCRECETISRLEKWGREVVKCPT